MRGLLLPQRAFHTRLGAGPVALTTLSTLKRNPGGLRARPSSLKVAAENSSSSSSEESDAAKRARSNHGKQFEAKTRRRGRPAWCVITSELW